MVENFKISVDNFAAMINNFKISVDNFENQLKAIFIAH
jgi:hypothetical protein